MSEVKTYVKGLGGLPSHDEKLGYASSGVTLLEVLVYGDVNMTDVDIVKETKAVVLWRCPLLTTHAQTYVKRLMSITNTNTDTECNAKPT